MEIQHISTHRINCTQGIGSFYQEYKGRTHGRIMHFLYDIYDIPGSDSFTIGNNRVVSGKDLFATYDFIGCTDVPKFNFSPNWSCFNTKQQNYLDSLGLDADGAKLKLKQLMEIADVDDSLPKILLKAAPIFSVPPYAVSTKVLVTYRMLYGEIVEGYLGELSTPGKGLVFLNCPNKDLMYAYKPSDSNAIHFKALVKQSFNWGGRIIQDAITQLYLARDRDTYMYAKLKYPEDVLNWLCKYQY